MSIIDHISGEELLVAGYVGIVAASLLGLLLLLLRMSRRDKQRLDELTVWAAAHQWTMEPRGIRTQATDQLKEHLLAVLPMLMRSDMRSGRVGALLTGVYAGRPTTVADYSYDVITDQGYTGTASFAIVVVEMPERSPSVRIVPRWKGSRLRNALARRHRAETGSSELDRRFKVSIGDRAVAARLIGPQLADLLAGCSPRLLDLRGQTLLLGWRGSVSVANIATRLDTASSTAELIERAVAGPTPGH
jgi:hypothetical protein